VWTLNILMDTVVHLGPSRKMLGKYLKLVHDSFLAHIRNSIFTVSLPIHVIYYSLRMSLIYQKQINSNAERKITACYKTGLKSG